MSFNLEEYFEEFYEKIKYIIKSRAPILHSSKTTEYGKGSETEYGHVKVENEVKDSENPVTSSAIKNNIDRIDDKINSMTIDTELNSLSTKPVENRVITNKINSLDGTTLKLNGLTDQTLEDAINVRIPGKDGKGLEFIFKRLPSLVDDWEDLEGLPSGVINPYFLDPVQTDDYVPEGWTDNQEEVTWEIPYQYVSTRTKDVPSEEEGGDGYTGIWSKFTSPKLWSVYGEKPFCHLRYADVQNPTNWNDTFSQPQTDTISGGKNYHKYEGYLWNEEQVLSDGNKDPTLFTWRIYRPTIGVAGQEGSFLHIAYASNEAGDNFNQYEGDYIGTCVTWEEEDPNDPDLYNWVRIKGNDGIDTEFVYYTTDVENFTGKPTDIKNQPALKRWCERPFPISEANPYCYVSVKDSNNDKWSDTVLWAKYGQDGEQGAVGERGEDGVGLEMIFKRNSSTQNVPKFIDSQDSNSFQGTVSHQVNGVNKEFHFQDNDFVPDGWTDNQQGVTLDYPVEWVSMRFKKISTDGKTAEWSSFNQPRVWATYSKDGKGVVDVIEKYYLHTSYQSLPSNLKDSDWLTTAPKVIGGKFLWTKSFITYTDGNVDTTTPICVTGRDGDGVHYVYYCCNDSSTPKIPTWSDIHGNTGTNTDYGRWVEDPVNVTSTNKYLYMSESTTHSYDTNGNKIWVDFKTPVLWSWYVTNGSPGSAGQGYEYAYYTSDKKIATSNKPNGNVSASTSSETWSSIPVPMTAENKYMYISYRTKTGTSYGSWSNSALWSQFGDKGDQGERGKDGKGLEHIFYRSKDIIPWSTYTASSSNKLKNPVNWTGLTNQNVNGKIKNFSDDDFYLSAQDWTDDAQGVDAENPYEYVSIRTKSIPDNGDGKTAQWGAFTKPSLWAKYGGDGKDGEGFEIVFYQSAGEITDWNSRNNNPASISTTATNFQTSDYIPWETDSDTTKRWSDDAKGVNENKPYEYASTRTKNDKGQWSAFTTPFLWAKFGEKGNDGVTPDTPALINAVTTSIENGEVNVPNVDALTLDGNSADSFMTAYPTLETIEQDGTVGGGFVECRILGSLIVINVIGCTVYNTGGASASPQNSGWEPIKIKSNTNITIPETYRPTSRIITGAGSTGGHSRANQVALGADGTLKLKRASFGDTSSSANETVDAFFIFFKDNRTNTAVSWNSGVKLYNGDRLIITLKSGNTVLSGRQVTIGINNTNYSRTTDTYGQAKLNLNLPIEGDDSVTSKPYIFSARFSGDKTYKPSTTGATTLTLNKSMGSDVKLTCTNQITEGYIRIGRNTPITGSLKNKNNNPIRNVTVKLSVAGMNKDFTALTDANGNFKIYHPNDGLNYAVSIVATTQLIIAPNSSCGSKTIVVGGVRYGGT